MRVAAVMVTLAGLSSVSAQSRPELPLREPRITAIRAVDGTGRPLEDADITSCGASPFEVRTDSSGAARLETSAPVFVVRKPGYRSRLVQAEAKSDFVVVLDVEPLRSPIARCRNKRECEPLSGFGSRFCFQSPDGVTATKQGNDYDYGARGYLVSESGQGVGITHGSGPIWTSGMPSDRNICGSIDYSEVVYSTGDPRATEAGVVVRDARGRTRDGKFWRYLGSFGESASYSDASEADALLLDQVLDSVCILPR